MESTEKSQAASQAEGVRKPGPLWAWFILGLIAFQVIMRGVIGRPSEPDLGFGERFVADLVPGTMVGALVIASYRAALHLLNPRRPHTWALTVALAVVSLAWIGWKATAHEPGPETRLEIVRCHGLPSREEIRGCLEGHAVRQRNEDFCEASVSRAERDTCLARVEEARKAPRPPQLR